MSLSLVYGWYKHVAKVYNSFEIIDFNSCFLYLCIRKKNIFAQSLFL